MKAGHVLPRGLIAVACLVCGISAGTAAPAVSIPAVQGRGLVSPLAGQQVHDVPGIVTAVARNGFYLQDPDGDGDPATSDAIFVYTDASPTVEVGEAVAVSGRVREYRPGGDKTGNLTVTELHAGQIRRIDNPFERKQVTPVLIGAKGRLPPTVVISAQAWGLPPDTPDGIHFHESLEGMLVRIEDAQVVAPTNRYGEVWVVAERGEHATGMNSRGGITVRDAGAGADYNPERIQLDDPLLDGKMPEVGLGDVLAPVIGVVSYSYGNYEVDLLDAPRVKHAVKAEEPETAPADGLSVATYNVDNLDPNDRDGDRDVADGRFAAIAEQIVKALGAPDIIALQEVQDSDGAHKSHITDAALTMNTLILAVQKAGGPTYAWAGVAPRQGRDGGQPGGNIRNVFLYNPARVRLVGGSHPGDATEGARVTVRGGALARMTPNPGRVSPRQPAFRGSRKPVAALFAFRNRHVLVINNHFTSRRGSSPLYGHIQPPHMAGARARHEQASALRAFVAPLLKRAPGAAIIVLGDFNEHAFAPPLQPLSAPPPTGAGLRDALATLPAAERYTLVFDGNSQALDHVFLSPALAGHAQTRIVHVNTGTAEPASDHDPVLVRISGLEVPSPIGHAAKR